MKARSVKPKGTKTGSKSADIDIIALYQRQYVEQKSVKADRRLDIDERAAYIKATKEKLGLNERVLGLSSKRSTWGGELRFDYPYLEFNGYYKKQHGIHVFKPHEMQWSLDQFLERMVKTRDEADERVEKLMDTRYEEVNELFKRIEEYGEQEAANMNTESLKEQLRELSVKAAEENSEGKNKIF